LIIADMTKVRKTIAEQLQSEIQTVAEPLVVSNEPVQSNPETLKPKTPKPAFQMGKKAMTLYFLPEVSKQLKQIALDGDITLHEVMKEAINDLFIKYRKPPIA
jgi:hypothetical protein